MKAPFVHTFAAFFGAIVLLAGPTPVSWAQASADQCFFQLGFANLAKQLPQNVGQCKANEAFNPANGNAEQGTTGGLLVWRKADNWTAFTDGYRTWLMGPAGLQDRLNDGPRFDWEQEIANTNTNDNTNDLTNTNTVNASGGNASGGTANAQGGNSSNTNTNTVSPVINVNVVMPGASAPTPTVISAPVPAVPTPTPATAVVPTPTMATKPAAAPVPAGPSAEAGQWVAWGRVGTGPGEFTQPYQVKVATDGSVYVLDGVVSRYGEGRVQRLSPTDACQCWWQPSAQLSGKSEAFDPSLHGYYAVSAIAIDAKNDIYLAHESWLSKWKPELILLQKPWPQLGSYYRMVIDQFGSFYATSGSLVMKIGPDGKELGRWGSAGSGPGQFRTPLGIALDGQGHLYVADSDNNRIQKLSVNGGRPVAQFGTKGTGPGQFNGPADIAIDQQGNMYVADTDNHRIQKLSPTGQFLQQWGNTGKFGTEVLSGDQPGHFRSPHGLALDSRGNLYVADTGNHRIQKLILNP